MPATLDYMVEVDIEALSASPRKPVERWMEPARRWALDGDVVRMPWNHAKTLGLKFYPARQMADSAQA